MLPEKMKIIDFDENFNFNTLPLDDNYVVYIKTGGKVQLSELLSFAKKMGETLPYGDNEYYTFNSIHDEVELHYDGTSAEDKRIVPDWLLFYMEEKPIAKGGEFQLVNCESVINDLEEDIIRILENTPLEFYGNPSIANPNPDPLVFSFSMKAISRENGIRVLRLQLPTGDPDFFTIEPDFVFCKLDGHRLRFQGMSGSDSANIFSILRKACFSEKHMLEVSLDEGDIAFVNNRYVFHGRKKCDSLVSRKMHRIQVVCDRPNSIAKLKNTNINMKLLQERNKQWYENLHSS